MRTCRHCGCTDERACQGRCSWIAEDVCSSCADKMPSGGDWTIDPEFAQRLAQDVLFFRLSGLEGLYLFSTLQVALRHPGIGGPMRDCLETLAGNLQERLQAATPAIGELLEAGKQNRTAAGSLFPGEWYEY